MVTTRYLAVLALAIFPTLSIAAAIPSPQVHTDADNGADSKFNDCSSFKLDTLTIAQS